MRLQFCYFSEKHKDVVYWGAPIDTNREGALAYFENNRLPDLIEEGGSELIYFYVIDEPTTDIFTREYWEANHPPGMQYGRYPWTSGHGH